MLAIGSPVNASESAQPVLNWAVTSSTGKYSVRVFPADVPIPIGRHHVWFAHVTTANGEVVSKAQLSVTGGMRAHGHGMPSQPEVTQETEPGLYKVEGVQFSMHGDWTLVINIKEASGADTVSIPLTIDF